MRPMSALPAIVSENLDEIRALCARHHVKRLAIFGSAVKGTFDPERSDLDFVVELLPNPDPLARGRAYLGLMNALRSLLGREIDLVERTAVRNPYFLQVLDLTEQSLYDAA